MVFNLARKVSSLYSRPEEAAKLYREVIALDPQGTAGTAEIEYPKAVVGYKEYAEFSIAANLAQSRKPDVAPLKAFIAAYPKSKLIERSYQTLAWYYGYQAPKEEAVKFYEDYVARFPDQPGALNSYVEWIVRTNGDLDRGLALADKIEQLPGTSDDPSYVENHAQLYALKGDKAKADELYGANWLDDRLGTIAYQLRGYVEFWSNQGTNFVAAEKAAEKMLDLVPADSSWYYRRVAAALYMKAGHEDKADAVFGPDFAKANAGDANVLTSYGAFWSQQGKNLGSALEAVQSAVAKDPSYYSYDTLSQIQLKMKDYPGALASAEKALALAQEVAKKYPSFSVKPMELKVQKIKDEMAKSAK